MDAIETAAVDLASLIVTSRALRLLSSSDQLSPDGLRHPKRMRRQIEAATLAYLRQLSRVTEAGFGDAELAECRCEAETKMPHAIQRTESLARLLRTQSGALADAVPLRHDLWRLARIVTHLRQFLFTVEVATQQKAFHRLWARSRRLRQRLRAAVRIYAVSAAKAPTAAVAISRSAALEELGADLINETQTLITVHQFPDELVAKFDRGVVRPLRHLCLDWGGAELT